MEWIFYPVTGAALAIAGISLMLYRRRAWVDAKRSLADTLNACRSLLALIAHFQQHRGMSSARLAGDPGFDAKLAGKAREIDRLFESLPALARSESGKAFPCLTSNDLALFRFQWAQLRETLTSLSVEQSIARHGSLIDQLLNWLAALGEARIEPLLGERGRRSVVRNYASRLPALAECLGQARAVGLSVATRRGCSAVARVRLMFLVARAEALLGQAADGSAPGERAASAVQRMAGLVRTRMLAASGVTVGVQEYFDIATQAVDGVFDWIAETGDQLANGGLTEEAGGSAIPAYTH